MDIRATGKRLGYEQANSFNKANVIIRALLIAPGYEEHGAIGNPYCPHANRF
jgi:hypothetical protein